jgi:hypothetical protein
MQPKEPGRGRPGGKCTGGAQGVNRNDNRTCWRTADKWVALDAVTGLGAARDVLAWVRIRLSSNLAVGGALVADHNSFVNILATSSAVSNSSA